MAAISQMANVLQSMVLTNGPQMILTPTYDVFWMYRPRGFDRIGTQSARRLSRAPAPDPTDGNQSADRMRAS